MNTAEEITCYHCFKIFYTKVFRLQEAKTISCFYCQKRIDKKKMRVMQIMRETQ